MGRAVTGEGQGASQEPAGVSVVLPALNLEGTIANTVRTLRAELQRVTSVLEFIIVDDGSTDATARVVGEICERQPDVRLLRNRRNLGKGVSVYLGVLHATYDKVCFTDADLPFTNGAYACVVQRLLLGHPFVAASRRMPDSAILVRMEVLGYAARRHLVGVAFNHIVRAGLDLPYRDTQCGLKAFDRAVGIELFQRLRSPRFLFDIELFLAAHAMGIPVDEVPVCIAYNDFKSSVRLAADSVRMFWGLLQICVRYRRGRYALLNPAMAPAVVREWTQEMSPGDRNVDSVR